MDLDLGDTRLIIREAEKHGLLRNQLAYVLATAFWETAHTMRPVREYGGETYLKKKKYYPYVGMGYVQLTWLANYQKASRELDVDFVANPKLLLKPEYAAPILVTGMVEGWFTGKKLSDYITLQKSDFRSARRIINGTDKRDQIAMIARDYDAALKAEGYGEEKAPQKPVQRPQPVPAPEPAPEPPRASPKGSGPSGTSLVIGGVIAVIGTALLGWWEMFVEFLKGVF